MEKCQSLEAELEKLQQEALEQAEEIELKYETELESLRADYEAEILELNEHTKTLEENLNDTKVAGLDKIEEKSENEESLKDKQIIELQASKKKLKADLEE